MFNTKQEIPTREPEALPEAASAVSAPDFQMAFESAPVLHLLLVPNYPAFTIVGASDAYLKATMRARDELVGRGLFEAFPDNPKDAAASWVDNLRESLVHVIQQREMHIMPVQKYDIPRPEKEGSDFEERYWAPSNSPVCSKDGQLVYIIHRVEDVTELVRSKDALRDKKEPASALVSHPDRMQAELLVRDRLLEEARTRIAERERAEQVLATKLRFTALNADIGVALTHLKEPREMLQSCAQALVTHLDAAFARIWLLNRDTDVLELQASAGIYTHLDGEHSRIPVGAFKIGWIAQEKKPHLTNDVVNDPRIGDREWAKREGMAAFAGYPLVVDGLVNGVMGLFSRTALKKDTLAVLGSVADSIALGVERKSSEDFRAQQALVLAQTHEDVVRSEERFRAFVTATSDVVYQMNPDWTEMRLLSGRDFVASYGAATKSMIDNYIHPEDRDRMRAAIQEAMRSHSAFELEHRVIRSDSGLRWMFSRAIPVMDAKGTIVEWLGAARDVTARKQAEEAITRLTAHSESQRRLHETILSSTPDLVYVFDLNHRFTYANKALLTMWGKTAEEAIGKTCLELGYEPWHAAMHDREIDQVIATRQPIRGDVPFSGAQGRRMYDYIFVPVLGLNGEVEAIGGTTRDVTERQTAEDELRRANQDLEQFAYAATHDLQEPTRTVKVYGELLARQYASELKGQGLDYLKFLHGSASRIDLLIQDLLSYMQAGRVERADEAAEAGSCLEAALANLAAGIAESKAEINTGLLPSVRMGETQLVQLFQNLISNAIKYRAPGMDPIIDVSAQRRDGEWEFTVRDNGIGIQEQYREQIFGLFKRLHNGDRYAGSGIGLALCKRMIERCEGRIWVESEPGQGAEFHFTLPG